jgi:alkaline phosphatase
MGKLNKAALFTVITTTLLTACATTALERTAERAAWSVEVPEVSDVSGETAQWWYRSGAAHAAANGAMSARAKNVIVFLGDGMSLTTVAAARILEGQRKGQSGEGNLLSWEHFPQTALAKTYNTDSQTPDSAGTMTAIATGVKSHMGAIGVSAGPRNDCAKSLGSPLQSWLRLADEAGLATGIVTTTQKATRAASTCGTRRSCAVPRKRPPCWVCSSTITCSTTTIATAAKKVIPRLRR